MTTRMRFKTAADNSRPFASHRYDVFGPKVGRTLTLFGRAQVNTWVVLESDPSVLSYCERPLLIPDVKRKKTTDFWVQYSNREEMWITSPGEEEHPVEEMYPQLAEWARSNECPIKKVKSTQGHVFLENWGEIIRDLSCNRRYVRPPLTKSILEMIESPRPIAALFGLLPDEDPVIVRVAAYGLLHAGKLVCDDIAERPLGPQSIIQKP